MLVKLGKQTVITRCRHLGHGTVALTVVLGVRGGFLAHYASVTASGETKRMDAELGRQGSEESVFLAEGR